MGRGRLRAAGLDQHGRRDLPGSLGDGPLAGFSRQQGVWPKHKREWPIDGNWVTGLKLQGPNAWVQLELHGGAEPLAIDQVDVEGRVQALGSGPENWTCTVMGSGDGKAWITLGQTSGMSAVGVDIQPGRGVRITLRHRYLRVVFDNPRAITWHVGEVNPPSPERSARRRA